MKNEPTRPYRKGKRARQEEETRRRITEAVVELHRTVGPANTKVTEVAERAGVSRMTVYNHFPSEDELIEACSTHWANRNPFPDPSDWSAIEGPFARLSTALEELYSFYRRTEDMLGKVLRDAPLVPPLAKIMEARWWTYVDGVIGVLEEGLSSSDPETRRERRALLRLAVDFRTWTLLTAGGTSDQRAAEIASSMVRAALGASMVAPAASPSRRARR